MAHATIQRTMQLLRDSWRGQLLALGFGSIVVAAVLLFSFGAPSLLLASTVSLLSIALSARAAQRSERGYDTLPSDLPGDVLRIAPRLLAQSALVTGPVVLAWMVILQVAGVAPLLGLLAMFLLVPGSLLAIAPQLLVIGAVAGGDRAWTPGHALTVAFRRDRAIQVHLLAVGGVVVASMCSLPLVLTAIVLATQLGPASPLAFGLAVVAAIPLLGCGSCAAWRVLGGVTRLQVAATGADAFGRAAPPAPDAPAPLVAAVDAPAEPVWAEGASWDIALDAGAAWGTWIRLPAATRAGLQLQWHAGASPEVAFATADGTWWRPGELPADGSPLVLDLAAGDTYVQLTSRAAVPQAIAAVLLVPGIVAA